MWSAAISWDLGILLPLMGFARLELGSELLSLSSYLASEITLSLSSYLAPDVTNGPPGSDSHTPLQAAENKEVLL